MKFFTNLFKRKTVGLIETNLDRYAVLLGSFPDERRAIITRDGQSIPLEYHVANLLIRERQLSFVEREVLKGRMHFKLLKLLNTNDSGQLTITFRQLLMAYCDSIFYFEGVNDTKEKIDAFQLNVPAWISHMASSRKWDLEKPLNIEFLRNNFRRIELGGESSKNGKAVLEAFAESSAKLMADHTNRKTTAHVNTSKEPRRAAKLYLLPSIGSDA